jgi:hypothetical protein
MYGVTAVCCFYVKGKDTILRVRCVERFLVAGLVASIFCESVSTGRPCRPSDEAIPVIRW